jgi:hypothetical protein
MKRNVHVYNDFKTMKNEVSVEQKKRIAFVLGGFGFLALIILLAKYIGDGWLVPSIFIIGWIVLVGMILNYFAKKKQ